MFKNRVSINENKVASDSGAVVLLKKFIASAVMLAFISVLSLQAGFVLNANAEGNPVTSAVTAPEVTPTPAPTSKPSNNGGNGGGGNNGGGGGSSHSGGGSSSAPACNNEAPKAPKIVSASSANKNEVTLYWEKAQGNVTHYSISYGLMKGKPLYGVTNIGNVTSYTVKGLSAGVTYFFQVNAVNGCTAGAASNEIGIKGGGRFINTPAVGFKPALPAVAGKTSQKTPSKSESKGTVKVVEPAQPVKFNFEGETKLNPGLAGKIVSFFKGLFN